MKILFIAPRYHPHIGGVEYVVKLIAERLVRLSREATIIVVGGSKVADLVREMRSVLERNIIKIYKD